MITDSPLSRIFGGASASVLDALLRSDGLTVRQIARITGIAPSTASTALRRLEARGLVRVTPVADALQYWVNTEHFAVRHLRDLEATARETEKSFPQLIRSALGSDPRSVILFGSTARGEADKDSDMDVLVIAHDQRQLDGWGDRALDLQDTLGRRLGGPLDVVVMAMPSKQTLRRPFWREVLRDGRLLFGKPLGA